MSCPYFRLECPQQRETASRVTSCPACGRFLKYCPQCGTSQREFANFCRACRTELPASSDNWLSGRGGLARLGLNTASLPAWETQRWESLEIRELSMDLRLGDTCRSLLGYDRNLIAVSQAGMVEIGGARLASPQRRLKADGPISCEPCIDRGILYLGAPGRVSAYSLGALTLSTPRLAPLWQLPVSGTPIQALTALDGRLYVTTYRQEGSRSRKEVQVIETWARVPPAPPRTLVNAARVSWLAADSVRRQVVFLSEDAGRLLLHTHTATQAGRDVVSRPLPWRPLADQVPIAFLGGQVFAVLGEQEMLVRIDAEAATFEAELAPDTKLFALSRDGDREWDGDGVVIDAGAVAFLRAGIEDSLAPHDRVAKGSPVLVRGGVAVVAMLDGQLRFYDLAHPPRHEVRHIAAGQEPITALASFQNYVAAGNAKGVVKVFELAGKGAGSPS